MLGTTLDVADSTLSQQLLELCLTAPRRVLPTLIRQYLPRRTEVCHAPLQRLDDQRGLLVVGQGPRDQESRVVVHERRHVHPLLASQEEGEDVRLPELVRLCPLEPTRRRRSPFVLRPCRRDQAFLVEDPTHLVLRDPERLEALEEVMNAAAPIFRVGPAGLDDGSPGVLHVLADAPPHGTVLKRRVAAFALSCQPSRHGVRAGADHLGDLRQRRTAVNRIYGLAPNLDGKRSLRMAPDRPTSLPTSLRRSVSPAHLPLHHRRPVRYGGGKVLRD